MKYIILFASFEELWNTFFHNQVSKLMLDLLDNESNNRVVEGWEDRTLDRWNNRLEYGCSDE